MHVATYVFPDAFGGAERFIHGLARAQVASGHEATVLTGNAGHWPAEEQRDGVRVLRYPLPGSHGLGFYLEVRRQVSSSLRRLAGHGFDILHAHQIASAVPALEATFPARRVFSFHASHQLEFEAERLSGAPSGEDHSLGLRDRIKSIGIRMLDRRCLGRAERVVVHTEFVRRQVEALMPSAGTKVRVIPPGIDFERFAPGDRLAARDRLGLPLEARLIVSVRRLVRRMGLDMLVRAAGLLARRGQALDIAIGGDGPERGALEALRRELHLEQKVHFLGRVKDEELPDLLRAADLIVVPSRSMEGFGLSTVEALACGTPVVATETGASPEILAPIDGALIVPATAEALAARLEELLGDPARRRELGERGLASVRARFSWPSVVGSLERVYRELVHAPAHA